MVKNSTGGNKSKGLARKNLTKRDSALRVSQEEGEIYAQIIKIMGGCIASAIDIDGNPLRAHIRGKFRGRGKRDNLITANTWVLVGLHSWQSDKCKPSEIRDCDILEVYNDMDKIRLKNSINSINWNKFIINETKTLGDDNNDENDVGFSFVDDTTEEYENLIASHGCKEKNTNFINDDEEINVDDI
jgi:translation initiation factor IF-1